MTLKIRASVKADTASIRSLLDDAFDSGGYESRLRDLIFGEREDIETEWVLETDSKIVGHILYTPGFDEEKELVGFHLAPVSVHPDFQRQGIGSQLIRETLNNELLANESVFVFGDPEFYEQFGFGRAVNVICPYDPDGVHFRALRWKGNRDPFVIGYHPAFVQAEEV